MLEIKTYAVTPDNEQIDRSLVRQLYYESKGRKTFALSIDFKTHINDDWQKTIDAVNIRIYNVKLEETEPEPVEKVRVLYDDEIAVLNLICENPDISNAEIARQLKIKENRVGRITKALKALKYVVKEDESKKRSRWILLRSPEDNKTKYIYFDGKIYLNGV